MVFVTSPLLYQHNIFFFAFRMYNMYMRCLATSITKKKPTKEKVKWLFSKWNANNWIKWYKYDLHQILKVCIECIITRNVWSLSYMWYRWWWWAHSIESWSRLLSFSLHSVMFPFIQFETDVRMIWSVILLKHLASTIFPISYDVWWSELPWLRWRF